MTKSILIIGCGDLGIRLGLALVNHDWTIYGARRNINQLPPKIQGVSIDLYQETSTQYPQLPLVDYVVFCAAPARGETQSYEKLYYHGLQNALNWLHQSQQKPKHLFITSSTAVYAQNNSEWVNEQSPTDPSSIQGKVMLSMEQLALAGDIPTTCIRLSGIYGPGRVYLINQARQGISYPPHPPLFSNRIHIDDAANLLHQLINHHQAGNTLLPYYIGVDNTPTPIQEVLSWLQETLKVDQQQPSTHLERRAGSKKLSNQLAKSIGWEPKYPSYKEGYTELLNNLT